MQSVYEGSIEIIFTVVLGFLNLIGGLKDLYDAIQLVRKISERHINKRLSDKFGNNFRVDTYAIVPRHEDYWQFEIGNMMSGHGSSGEAKRDVFFYYLLVVNIILLILIGILVFGAVVKVYYGM